jgi:hypothetical protein
MIESSRLSIINFQEEELVGGGNFFLEDFILGFCGDLEGEGEGEGIEIEGLSKS